MTVDDSGERTVVAQLHAVTKRFDSRTALSDVELSVHDGDFVALLGPNGAGKSTALSLLLGLRRATHGHVTIFGKSPTESAVRRRIGVMLQDVTLPPEFTPRELIAVTSAWYPHALRPDEVLALAGIERLAFRRYRTLSGGEKRQVQFALALCGRPDLLILDEPSAGLDFAARNNMWCVLRRLAGNGVVILLTTHHVDEAEALANRIVILHGGRVLADGSVSDIRGRVNRGRISCTSSISVEHVRTWSAVTSAHRAGNEVIISTTDAASVLRNLLGDGVIVTDVEVRRASLTEALTQLLE